MYRALIVMLLTLSSWSAAARADGDAAIPKGRDADAAPSVPEYPTDAAWTGKVVVVGTWLIVGAILAGPVVKYFADRPKAY